MVRVDDGQRDHDDHDYLMTQRCPTPTVQAKRFPSTIPSEDLHPPPQPRRWVIEDEEEEHRPKRMAQRPRLRPSPRRMASPTATAEGSRSASWPPSCDSPPRPHPLPFRFYRIVPLPLLDLRLGLLLVRLVHVYGAIMLPLVSTAKEARASRRFFAWPEAIVAKVAPAHALCVKATEVVQGFREVAPDTFS